MKHSTRAVLFGSIGLVLGGGLATSVVHAQEVTIREPWVRGTVRGQKATGAFMQLTATEAASLVAVESPVLPDPFTGLAWPLGPRVSTPTSLPSGS